MRERVCEIARLREGGREGKRDKWREERKSIFITIVIDKLLIKKCHKCQTAILITILF